MHSRNNGDCKLSYVRLQYLADRTVNEWDNILRILHLEEHVIDNVKADNTKPTNQAFEGYKKWWNSSSTDVCFCFLYAALIEVGRTDVVKIMGGKPTDTEIVESISKISLDEENKIKASSEGDKLSLEERINMIKQRKVSELPSKRKIADILDKDGTGNVTDVALQCGFTNEEMIALEQHAAGGGKPALSFYTTLKETDSDDSVSKLCDCFKTLNLTKAINVLEHYGVGDTIANISPLDIDKLSKETTFSIMARVKDWKDVAEYFGKDPADFEPTIRKGYAYSQTTELFSIIRRKYLNGINIGQFLDFVDKAGNTEATIEIENQITELAENKF